MPGLASTIAKIVARSLTDKQEQRATAAANVQQQLLDVRAGQLGRPKGPAEKGGFQLSEHMRNCHISVSALV